MDMLLDRIGPYVKYLANDHLMRFNSRLLDVPMVKRWMIRIIKRSLLKAMTGEAHPSLLERTKTAFATKSARRGGMNNG
jgi:hypothetical protein